MSGNPGGRPVGLSRRVREATEDGAEPIDFLLAVMRDPGESPRVRVEAAKLILDRGWGRSAPVIDAEIRQTAELSPAEQLAELSDAELAAKLREQADELEARSQEDTGAAPNRPRPRELTDTT